MTRKQNRDYANYLITVAYYESQKIESWENKKISEDDIKYHYDRCEISETVEKYLEKRKEKIDLGDLKQFAQNWENYLNVVSLFNKRTFLMNFVFILKYFFFFII